MHKLEIRVFCDNKLLITIIGNIRILQNMMLPRCTNILHLVDLL